MLLSYYHIHLNYYVVVYLYTTRLVFVLCVTMKSLAVYLNIVYTTFNTAKLASGAIK